MCDPPPDITQATELAYTGDTHVFNFGPSGTGKTRRLLLTNLFRLKHWSMLIIDPKGQLAQMTGEERAKTTDVYYLDPFNVSGKKSNGFNPFKSLHPKSDTFNDDIFGFADAMIKTNPRASEPHWTASAQDWVAGIITFASLVALHGDGSAAHRLDNLGFVRKQLGLSPRETSDLAHAMIDMAEATSLEELAVKAGRFADFTPDNKELSGIVSTALTETRWLASDPIKRDLTEMQRPLDFVQMRERPTDNLSHSATRSAFNACTVA